MDDCFAYLPEHIRASVDAYLRHGVPQGGFVTAVIENDLTTAVVSADHINITKLQDIVLFFINYMPQRCWGSEEKRLEWIKIGGLEGIKQAANEKE